MSSHRSEQLDELAAALCAAQAEFVAIPKDSTNPFFKSKYAGLPKVVEVASPILTKHGLSITQFIGFDEHGDTLTTWLLHKSGQFVAQSMRLHLTKQDAQGQGSATTYARRYSYMAVLGLVADEDDDGNNASRRQQGEAPPRKSSPPRRQEPRLAAEALAELRETYSLTGWSTDELRMRLTALGAPNVSDIKTAMTNLTEKQAAELRTAMNIAIDAIVAQEQEPADAAV